MRTREVILNEFAENFDPAHPMASESHERELIVEVLLDIRDLLTPKPAPTFPENTGTPLQTNKESK